MTTITGPIKITKENDLQSLLMENIKIKLPFEATGFKSTKLPKNVDLTGITLAKDTKTINKKQKKKKN
jgi:hypothetical protein